MEEKWKMAEAAKQFFVGFIHPRTWLAAILALVAAFIVALLVSIGIGPTGSTITDIANTLFSGNTAIAKALVQGVFGFMILPYKYFSVTLTPIIVLVAGGLVGGLIFGATSKKERVGSKGIIGGLNIAVIYLVVVVVSLVIWANGFSNLSSFGSNAWTFLNSIAIDMLFSFLIVWWVAALIAILILSMKSD